MDNPNGSRPAYAFAEFTLDTGRGALLRNGTEVGLRPKSFRVLTHLVERHGQLVSKEELLAAVWPHAFVSEGALTQCVIDIRRALGESGRGALRTIPRRGYIFDAPVTESAPARTAFSDSTSDHVRDGLVASLRLRPRSWDWRTSRLVSIVLVVTGIGVGAGAMALLFSWPPSRPGPLAADRVRSIAVLPFTGASEDLADVYLADGLTEGVVRRLSRAQDLRVTSYASTSQLRDSALPATEVGRRLGVEAILRGSVRRRGGTLEVRAELVETSGGTSLWVRSFDGPDPQSAGDTGAIEADVAGGLAAALQVTLPASAPSRIDPAAREAYLKGRYHLGRRSAADLGIAAAHLQRAIEIYPDYAAAHAALAEAYVFDPGPDSPAHVRSARGTAEANRALALDPDRADAHAILGFIQERFDWNWQGAERSFARAIALDPTDAKARSWHSALLAALGRGAAARAEAEAAYELDPLSLQAHVTLGWHCEVTGEYDRAVALFRDALQMQPGFIPAQIGLVDTLRAQGKPDESLAEIDRILAGNWNVPQEVLIPQRIMSFAAAGHRTEAERALSALEALTQDRYVPPVLFAVTFFALGRDESGFHALDRAYAAHEIDAPSLRLHPEYDRVRSDPRFQDLLARLKLPS